MSPRPAVRKEGVGQLHKQLQFQLAQMRERERPLYVVLGAFTPPRATAVYSERLSCTLVTVPPEVELYFPTPKALFICLTVCLISLFGEVLF